MKYFHISFLNEFAISMIWTTYISLEKDHQNPFEVFHVKKSFRTKYEHHA